MTTDYHHFSMTLIGRAACMVIAIKSAIASAFVLAVIIKTRSKLSTTYHRITFYMSFWEILSSIAIALGPLMMPLDVPYAAFRGLSYGNSATCDLQAFILVNGTLSVLLSFLGLCIYYLLSICYKVREDLSKKVFEPLVLLVVTTFSTGPSIYFAKKHMINPSPYSTTCFITNERADGYVYYEDGLGERTSSGVLDSGISLRAVRTGCVTLLAVFTAFTVASMYYITKTASRRAEIFEGSKKRCNESYDDGTLAVVNSMMAQLHQQYSEETIIKRQAFVHSSFAIIMGCALSSSILWDNYYTNAVALICRSAEGFLIAFIFFHNNFCHIKRSNPLLSWWEAICIITFAPVDIPELFVTIPPAFPRSREDEELGNDISRHSGNCESQNIGGDAWRGLKGSSIHSSAHQFSFEISLNGLELENNTQTDDLQILTWNGIPNISDATD
uniref:G-protein coupled receptors family 1 profile domain-containing protein n=1 Tax=Chaetoceros debilis TaxID=122233 RepID=A0A7S3PV47_9STRA